MTGSHHRILESEIQHRTAAVDPVTAPTADSIQPAADFAAAASSSTTVAGGDKLAGPLVSDLLRTVAVAS